MDGSILGVDYGTDRVRYLDTPAAGSKDSLKIDFRVFFFFLRLRFESTIKM